MARQKLEYQVSANTANFARGMKKVQGMASRTGSAISGALGIGIGATAAVAGVKALISYGDQIGKAAKRIGISAEEFQKQKFAAERSGASIGDVEKAYKRMSAVVYDAGKGLKTNVDALSDLGLTFEQLKGMKPEEQFNTILEAIGKIKDASTRSALAQRVFGKSGTMLIPMIQDYKALRQEVEELGGVMSNDAVKAAEDFEDQMTNLTSSLKAGVANSGLLVWLTGVTKEMTSLATSVKELGIGNTTAEKAGVGGKILNEEPINKRDLQMFGFNPAMGWMNQQMRTRVAPWVGRQVRMLRGGPESEATIEMGAAKVVPKSVQTSEEIKKVTQYVSEVRDAVVGPRMR